ncbi:hypothetical protein, variant [Cryptococcus amylolentus CBS 6039]|uniref:Inositol polyphosphate-related phosphatase domain-containing protein n=1 Tax=Cryptococcus amylolentus CBS 6039 TaxID=1295533 RepID=A0A1E3HHC1_9TREE|nr:hypothetical protein, variant [Cryptococcus amylolentus CBS 6039]ODN75742.1 hypothetical protein, variant [Cryptococcus amylolentus CBS 6039]
MLPSLTRRPSTLPPLPFAPTPSSHQQLFRASEHVIVHQPCRVKTALHPFHHADVLLVVSKDTARDDPTEEAAVFVISQENPLDILYIIPVSQHFTHRIEQTPPSPSASFFHQSARPHTTLILSLHEIQLELRIAATQSRDVQRLVTELRRFVEHSKKVGCPPSLSHAWTGLYPVQTPQEEAQEDVEEDPVVDEEQVAVEAETVEEVKKAEQEGTAELDVAKEGTPEPQETPASSIPLETPADLPTTLTINHNLPSSPLNPTSPNFNRPAYLRSHVLSQSSSYTSTTPLNIRCATYNVNNKVPPKGTTELAGLVGQGEEDVIVVGLQEADLRVGAMFLVMTQYVGVVTIILVRKSLRPHVSRIETAERGIGLLGFGGNKAGVAVRMKVYDTVFCFVNSHLAAFSTALDRRRLDFSTLRSTLTFPRPAITNVDAAKPAITRTNSSVTTRSASIKDETLPKDGGQDEQDDEGEKVEADVVNPVFEEFWPDDGKALGVDDSHVLIWLGDLNYRIDLPDSEVREKVEAQEWQSLLEKDQLRLDITAKKSFARFEEGAIDFPPTFKYVHGSSTFDFERAPAYTDRVLYSLPPSPLSSPSSSNPTPPTNQHALKITSYTSHPILWSDHRPVSCSFAISASKVDQEARKAVWRRALGELDRLDDEWRSSLVVEVMGIQGEDVSEEEIREKGAKAEPRNATTASGGGAGDLDFGAITWRTPKTGLIRLTNPGKVPSSFSFKHPSASKNAPCKSFIHPFPARWTVQPGEGVVLRVRVEVDEWWAGRMTLGMEEVADVLVLQVDGGRDTFITLQGTFTPSTLSLPLQTLSSLPSPIQSLPLSERKTLARPILLSRTNSGVFDKDQTPPPSTAFRPVNQIWRLLEVLMASPPPFTAWQLPSPSLLPTIHKIIDSLDDDSALPEELTDGQVIGGLIHYLASIPGGLLDSKVRTVIEKEEVGDRDGAFGILESVGQVETNVLIGLMSVVRLCLARPPPSPTAEEIAEVEATSKATRNDTAAARDPDLPADKDEVAPAAADSTATRERTESQDKKVLEGEEGGGVFELGDDEDDEDDSPKSLQPAADIASPTSSSTPTPTADANAESPSNPKSPINFSFAALKPRLRSKSSAARLAKSISLAEESFKDVSLSDKDRAELVGESSTRTPPAVEEGQEAKNTRWSGRIGSLRGKEQKVAEKEPVDVVGTYTFPSLGIRH